MKNMGIIGRRIIKTGISVFITALICIKLNLPVEFAVITAIVTIEPTASDSIRKGLIRLPASAIGAGLAVFFVSIWGETALTYTLAAIFTIFLCQKLKLHDGILVATLTAVAMVPDIHGSFLLTFFSRLGTTFIGLTVSSIINFFILPPKYTPLIKQKLNPNFQLAALILTGTMQRILTNKHVQIKSPSPYYFQLRQATEKVSEMLSFQEREWRYHKIKLSEYRYFYKLKRLNTIMQKIVLHLGNLQYLNEPALFSKNEINLLMKSVNSIQSILTSSNFNIAELHYSLIEELDTHLKFEANQNLKSSHYIHHFTTKRIVYFELLSIHDCLEELQGINTISEVRN